MFGISSVAPRIQMMNDIITNVNDKEAFPLSLKRGNGIPLDDR
jgi:hypothetical protein